MGEFSKMRSPTLLGSGAVRRAVSIGAAGRRGLVDLLFSGALLFRAFPRLNLLFALGAAHGPLRRRKKKKKNKSHFKVFHIFTAGSDRVLVHSVGSGCLTSSSLSDVSESVDAAGLFTGSSCSPESTLFLFAKDNSS